MSDTIIDLYCHLSPARFLDEMNKVAPKLGNIAARLRGVQKIHDLDARFMEMDQFGDYQQVVSQRLARASLWPASPTTPWPSFAGSIPIASPVLSPRFA
jgi:hypothetical protein